MAEGIVLSPASGRIAEGTAVGAGNPMPVYTPSGYGVQVSYGTVAMDLVTWGTYDGPIPMSRSVSAGTFEPAQTFPPTLSTCIPITGTTIATLIAATTGSRNYVIGWQFSNTSATLTSCMLIDNTTWKKTLGLAASGGGNNFRYDYPGWAMAGTNTVTCASLVSAVSGGTIYANIDWYVAP